MEFVQFHPTCLFHHRAKNFLISEAVRGEGALLLNRKKKRFLREYEPEMLELATRDKVARAIDSEMKKSGADCVYLDITAKGKEYLKNRFPTIYDKCQSLGIHIDRDAIPVVPAAHYLCGGVKTNIHGQTSVSNLFALGETACTGLHGGNRLASNSLLEAVVFSNSAYQFCKDQWLKFEDIYSKPIEPYYRETRGKIDEEILINHNWDIIRRVMWNYVGIVRKRSRLEMAKQRIAEVKMEVDDIVNKHEVTPNMLELQNISLVATLIIEASLRRKDSVGLHYILKE